MKLKLLVFVALFAIAFADDDVEDPDVLVFDESNFETEVKRNDLVLVEFYAPWCGHCKRLKPEYAKAATLLKREDPPVPLAKVDCTANQDVCSKYGVSGYPTLKVFKGGAASDYGGPRESAGIVSYMKKKAGPSSKELKTMADLEKINKQNYVVIGFFESDSSPNRDTFKTTSDKMSEDFKFAHTFSSEIMDKVGHKNEIVIFRPQVMANKMEESKVIYSSGDIGDFIKENMLGMVGYKTQSNDKFFKKPLITVYFEADYVKNPKGTQYWRNRVMKVAKKFIGKDVHFAIANKGDYDQEIGQFGEGIGADGKPFALVRGAADEKFKMDDEFSVENFEKFVNAYLAGDVQQYLKSEAEPSDNDGPVKVVVASTFDKIVNDPEKDVLIEFYAPWCGHCKNLEPKYNELAEKLQDEPNVVIAKMDATANDVPGNYNVRGFPTIYYSPKDSKTNPKQYNGGREVDDFIKYLAAESTDPLKGFTRKGKAKKSEL